MPSSSIISPSSFTSSVVTSHCADDIPSLSYVVAGRGADYIE